MLALKGLGYISSGVHECICVYVHVCALYATNPHART